LISYEGTLRLFAERKQHQPFTYIGNIRCSLSVHRSSPFCILTISQGRSPRDRGLGLETGILWSISFGLDTLGLGLDLDLDLGLGGLISNIVRDLIKFIG